MKKILSKFTFAFILTITLMTSLFVITSFALDDIEWGYELNEDNASLTITGVTIRTSKTNGFAIPESIFVVLDGETGKTYPVTAIDENAFSDNAGKIYGTLTIPSSVISIGDNAFANTHISGDLVIPDSVTTIGKGAFSGLQEQITSITLSKNLTSIPEKAFYESNIAGALTIPYNITSIGKNAFANTKIEGELVVPFTISSLGERAFEKCDKLTSVTLYTDPINPNEESTNKSLTIGNYAFSDCSSMSSITLGIGVTSIGNYAFSNNSALTEINFNATNAKDLTNSAFAFYKAGQSAAGITFTVGANVTKIPSYLFYVDKVVNSPRITSIVFEENSACTTIGSNAFANSYYLTNIKIADSITKISSSAFENCYSLTSLTTGTNLATIESNAFKNCYKLVEIYNLSKINIVSKPGASDYGYVGAYVIDIYSSLDEPSNLITTDKGFVMYDGDICYLLAYVGNESSVLFPTSCNGKQYEIYEYAFYKYPTAINLVLSENITVISKYAFKEANINGSLVIPDSVTEIYEEAFANCKGKITKLTLSKNLTEIKSKTFYDSYLIANFTFPEGLTYIGDEAFAKTLIHGDFVIPEGVTYLGTSAFNDCYGIINVVLPTTLKEIKSNTFYGCISLTSINLENVNILGSNCFYNCQALLHVEFSKENVSIASKAFGNCYSLSGKIDLSTATSLSSDAFQNCKRIDSFVLPNINVSFFSLINGCSSLKAIYTDAGNTEYFSVDGVLFKITDKSECVSTDTTENGTKYISVNGIVYVLINDVLFKTDKTTEDVTVDDIYTTESSNEYISIDDVPYVLDEDVLYKVTKTTLVFYPFYKEGSIYTVPSHVTVIGESAFSKTTNLDKVVIKDTVVEILASAFANSSIKSAFIPDSIKKLNSNTFSSCASLEWVVLGSGIESVSGAFSNTTAKVYSRNEYLSRPSDVSADRYFTSKSQCVDHLYGFVDDDPTCQKSGYNKCTFCDKMQYLKILDHSGPIIQTVELSCITDGYSLVECTICNETVKIDMVAHSGHRSNYTSIAPTDTQPGYIYATCTVCYETYLSSFIPHGSEPCDNHTPDSITITPQYSCKTNSLAITYCKDCGEKIDVSVPVEKSPCNYVFEMRIESTCSINGQIKEKCSICDNIRITTLDLAPHSHAWYTVEGNKGYEYSTCSVCGIFETNEVDYSIYDMLLSQVSAYYKTYYAPDTVALLSPIWDNRDLNLTQDAVDYNVELLRDILSNIKYNVTDVPVVFIEKTDGTLNRNDYTGAKIYVAYMDENGERQTEAVDLNGEIRTRGNATNDARKYPYNIKFSNKVDLFGMGAGKKYCLLANLYDQTLIRNAVVIDFAKSIGLEYTPNYTIVEVYYNGEYDGVYMLTTPLDIDENRIEIDEEEDFLLEVENKNTGGLFYITFDKRNTDMNMYMHLLVDQPEELTAKGYSTLISTFYQINIAIFSEDWDLLQQWVDVESVAKYYLLHEYLKEVDMCYDSTRFYIKDKKLYGGPVWDFDFGLGNVASSGGNESSHSAYNNSTLSQVETAGGAELGVVQGDSTTGYWARGIWEGSSANGFFNELYMYSDEFIDLVSQYVQDYDLQMQLLYKSYYSEEEGKTYVNVLDSFHKDQDFTSARIRNWQTYQITYPYSSTTKKEISYNNAISYLRDWLERRHQWIISAYVDIDARP